ncbi:hypothetical protein K0M31_015367 [Melipona bicolor]|uniref:Uncharacterized protein n=1 Tax=Melipona bicolor TaxID=60889 RepID=A0AA40FFU0_9HYME|nr:hypothetical protein K0M31_015367 [Melipona bicolor]
MTWHGENEKTGENEDGGRQRVGLKWRSLIELIPIRIELVGDYGSGGLSTLDALVVCKGT